MSPGKETWVVKSETDLEPGALAYWGPFKSRAEARKEFADELDVVAVISVPRPVTEEPA